MIKGVNKNIIVVDPPKKSSFEKIFFIVKVKSATDGSRDMITEANRLIGDSLSQRGGARKMSRAKGIGIFICGALFGGAAVGLVTLLILL